MDVSTIVVHETVFEGCDMRGATLAGRSLAACSFKDADLSRADLTTCDFSRANLQGCDFAGAALAGASLVDAHARFADFTGANLRAAVLTGADVSRAAFRGAQLTRAKFDGANLTETVLAHASAEHASFEAATLQDADLSVRRSLIRQLPTGGLDGSEFTRDHRPRCDLGRRRHATRPSHGSRSPRSRALEDSGLMTPRNVMLRLEQQTTLRTARVLRAERDRVQLEFAGELVWATMALAFCYQAVSGDTVLAIGQDGAWYVIGLLQGAGKTSLTVPGDLCIRAPAGAIELSAARGVQIKSPSVQVIAGKLELLAQALFERFEHATRRVVGTLQTSSGRVRTRVAETYDLKAARILERADGDVKIDGRAIKLG